MKLIYLATATILLSSVCHAQGIESIFGKRYPAYRAASELVTKPSSKQSLFPPDAVWARESYHKSSDSFFGRELVRVYRDKDGAWRGLWGTDSYELLELSRSRMLFEKHGSRQGDFFVMDKRPGGFLIKYSPGRKSDSRFARALRRAGLRSTENLIHGNRAKILGFLRNYDFEASEVDNRWQRPTHDDMKLVWASQQLKTWQDRYQQALSQTAQRMSRLEQLTQLGVARLYMRQITKSGVNNLEHNALDKIQFGPSTYALDRMVEGANKILPRIHQKIMARMILLAKHVDSTTLVEGEGSKPEPGDTIRFHYVLKLADGKVVADSRKEGKPTETAIAGKMPEGVAYALCSMKMGGKAQFRIPAGLAFGKDRGDVTLEVELLRYVRRKADKPPIKFGLMGYKLAPLAMKETASKLLYNDLQEGKGPRPRKGQRLVVKRATWSATGEELDKAKTITIQLGNRDLPAGLNEGLASMRPGGMRVLCMPRQLAYRTKSRKGMAIRMVVSLERIEP